MLFLLLTFKGIIMRRNLVALAGALSALAAFTLSAAAETPPAAPSCLFCAPVVTYGSTTLPQSTPIPREVISYDSKFAPGTVVISTEQRRMYFILPDHQAVRYGVGVGRPGFEWSGQKKVVAKKEWPDWTPPSQMLKRRPDLPRHMAGGIENPLGARAMYLGSSLYRIHGSNEPDTIGQAVSSGCIRMTNEDVTDLYERVKIGTTVVVQR